MSRVNEECETAGEGERREVSTVRWVSVATSRLSWEHKAAQAMQTQPSAEPASRQRVQRHGKASCRSRSRLRLVWRLSRRPQARRAQSHRRHRRLCTGRLQPGRPGQPPPERVGGRERAAFAHSTHGFLSATKKHPSARQPSPITMAKGLRSSVKKRNRSKLRARVFEPVENARTERLHQKLLEAAQQQKPEPPKKSEMDVDSAQGNSPNQHKSQAVSDRDRLATNTTDDAAKDDDFPKGSSFLTASVPPSLCDEPTDRNSTLDPPKDRLKSRNLFHLLGLCADIVGFTDEGDLEFAFDPLPSLWSSDQGLTVAS